RYLSAADHDGYHTIALLGGVVNRDNADVDRGRRPSWLLPEEDRFSALASWFMFASRISACNTPCKNRRQGPVACCRIPLPVGMTRREAGSLRLTASAFRSPQVTGWRLSVPTAPARRRCSRCCMEFSNLRPALWKRAGG